MLHEREAIKAAIEELPEVEHRKFADWFGELEEQTWDKQIEQDSSPEGGGMPMLAELERELAEVDTQPREGGLPNIADPARER